MRKLVIYVLASISVICVLINNHESRKDYGSPYASGVYSRDNYYNSDYHRFDKGISIPLPQEIVKPSLKRNDSILSILKSGPTMHRPISIPKTVDYSYLYRNMDSLRIGKLHSGIHDDNNFSSELSFDVRELKSPKTSLSDLKLNYETSLRTMNPNNTLTRISSFDTILLDIQIDTILLDIQKFKSEIHIDSITEDNFSIPSDDNV